MIHRRAIFDRSCLSYRPTFSILAFVRSAAALPRRTSCPAECSPPLLPRPSYYTQVGGRAGTVARHTAAGSPRYRQLLGSTRTQRLPTRHRGRTAAPISSQHVKRPRRVKTTHSESSTHAVNGTQSLASQERGTSNVHYQSAQAPATRPGGAPHYIGRNTAMYLTGRVRSRCEVTCFQPSVW